MTTDLLFATFAVLQQLQSSVVIRRTDSEACIPETTEDGRAPGYGVIVL